MSLNQHSKFVLILLNHEWITFLPKICAKDATYSSSCVGIAKFGCHEVWNLSREVIPLTHSETGFIERYKTIFFICCISLIQTIQADVI